MNIKNKQPQSFTHLLWTHCLAKNVAVISRKLETANYEFPVFSFDNVSESAIMKTLDWLKRSKTKEVFDLDARIIIF